MNEVIRYTETDERSPEGLRKIILHPPGEPDCVWWTNADATEIKRRIAALRKRFNNERHWNRPD